ncbi:hypothetical protein [Janibacter limosus]|uniref:hypothetical protein n=1 Tax=Janibacter limosus TaxID=53458 RepID=UPI00082A8331|nr:hypothetical protein [Janibacter limosus]
MTAPHEIELERRRPLKSVFTVVGVLALVGMFAAGVISFLPGGLDRLTSWNASPQVEGQILWSSEDSAVQLGPAGWITHPGEGGDYVARNVRTGESWTIGDLSSRREITPDGVVVQPDGGRILVQREGSTHTTTTTKILAEFGDDRLWPGTDSQFVGVSERHVAVLTCLAPKPSRLMDEVEGGHAVLAGVDLQDASVDWTRDTGAGCGVDVAQGAYPSTLPAQRYLLLEPAEEQVMAVDLDTGSVAQRWSGAKRYWFAVQGENLLATDGQGTATWSSLRTGKQIAEVSCPLMSLGGPGDTSRQLSPEATPFVECRDSVQTVDGDRFTEIATPPVADGEPIADGDEVAVGHLVLRREGGVIHLRDGLAGEAIGDLDVPEDFEVAGYGPVGRLITFVDVSEGSERSTVDYRVFDTTTADLVLAAGPGMSTGADLSPDGLVLTDLDEDFVDEGQPRTWVAGPKKVS